MVQALPVRRQAGFVLETFRGPREEARLKARDYFERWPKGGYMTVVDSHRELEGDMIEFTMRRLPTAD